MSTEYREAGRGREPEAPAPAGGTRRGVAGIDLHPHGLAVVNEGQDGSRQAWPQGLAERLRVEVASCLHLFAGKAAVGVAPGRIGLHVPELWQADADRLGYLVGVLATLVVDASLAVGRPLAREDLGFGREQDSKGAFHRYSGGFPYSALAEAVDRRARRLGAPVVRADPAYTSVEGRWRVAPDLGWSVHQAAVLCMGRKALGYRRRSSRPMRGRLQPVRQALAVEAGRGTEVEAATLNDRQSAPTRQV